MPYSTSLPPSYPHQSPTYDTTAVLWCLFFLYPSFCPSQLASQLRQQRLRADAEAADASQLKAELERAGVDRMSLKKEIGLLSRQNEDLAMENGE